MDIVEEIKQRINIEDLIGEYVTLSRAGRNWRGLSPFNNEKTPSFIVSPEKQIWHDFSSGKGGNAYSFIMEMEGLDFKEALRFLAARVGLEDELNNSSNKKTTQIDKERLYSAIDLATKFYQVQFKNNQVAINYIFNKRKFSKETALAWRFGYSPNSGTALRDFLIKRGYSPKELKDSGLVRSNYKNEMDMFRGRLMIPLQDQQGKVIGFTARILDDNIDVAKYINTPQTILYDKSRHVFGLHFAKESIRRLNYVVITEGNLDVISSHQAGITNVVATAGTAITSYHLKILSRFTADIRLSFDSDKAGIAATERAIVLASKLNISLSIIDITTGKDPDELIKKDPNLWIKAIEKNVYAVDWMINRYQQVYDIKTAEGKRKFTDSVLPIINQLTDEIEKEFYLEKVSKLIEINRLAINQKSKNFEVVKKILKQPKVDFNKSVQSNQEVIKTENRFIALILIRSPLRDLLKTIKKSIFAQEENKKIFEYLDSHLDFDFKKSASSLAEFNISSDYVKMLTLLYEELYQQTDLENLYDEAVVLRLRLVREYVKKQKEIIQTKLITASDDEISSLMKKVNELNTFLNRLTGEK